MIGLDPDVFVFFLKCQKHQEFVRYTNYSGSLWVLALPCTFKRWRWFLPTQWTFIHSSYVFLTWKHSMYFVSDDRRPSLLLGPKSIRTTWAGNKRTEHFHTPDHSIFAGHSFCPDISRRCSQLFPHSVRSGVWLGAQQVWSAGSQWHQWCVLQTLKILSAFRPWTLTNFQRVFFRSVFPSPAEVP